MKREVDIEHAEIPIAVPVARWKAQKEGIDLRKVTGSGPRGVILMRDVEKYKVTQKPMAEAPKETVIRASSLARKMAEMEKISLETIEGTGVRGRVMMSDVTRVAEKVALPNAKKRMLGQVIPMTQMRKVIAKRMSQSAFTAPHIHFLTDVKMGELIRFREKFLPDFEGRFQVRISVNDFIIKAVASCILEYPMLNATVRGEEILIMPEVNIGVAVALEEGLIVPAIPRVDEMSLGEIAQVRTDLIQRAMSGRLGMEEIERGTFTISSLAQFDITYFTAVLNPPQSGILSIGKTCEAVTVREGNIIVEKIAGFGLTVDHRIVDGAMAAAFLQKLKTLLEDPVSTFMHF